MSELSTIGRITEALNTAKAKEFGVVFSPIDVIELLGHIKNLEEAYGLSDQENKALLSRAEKAEAMVKELETGTYCAYCGERFELDDSAAVLVGEHIAKCEKHPMRGLDREILRLQRLLDWAMKPEDQKKLQQQFDDFDEKERIKKEFHERLS